MRKVILFPIGKAAQENYSNLVEDGVNLSGWLEENGVTDINEEKIKIWGTTLGVNGSNLTKFKKIKDGDIAVFVKNGEIFSYGIVKKIFLESYELAKAVLNTAKWCNWLVFSEVEVLKIPIDFVAICNLIGYNTKYRIQGFNVLSEEKSYKIIEEMKINDYISDRKTIDVKDDKLEKIEKIVEDKKKDVARIFISYSHIDEKYKIELTKHLKILELTENIKVWDDKRLEIGEDFNTVIVNNMKDSDIIIILLSADYFTSEYCMNDEWSYIKEHWNGRLMPIIVRDCLWESMLQEISAIKFPKNNESILGAENKDKEYKEITAAILRKIKNEQE